MARKVYDRVKEYTASTVLVVFLSLAPLLVFKVLIVYLLVVTLLFM